MTHIITFDVGSTNVRSAVGTPTGELTTEVFTEPTEPRRLTEQIVERVAALQDRSTDPIDAVCIASTGLVDHERGVVEKFDALDPDENRYDLDITATISSVYDVTVAVDNDVNTATLGEYRFSVGDDYDTMLYLNIGSGIGAGIVTDGMLIRGEHSHAGEVGMMTISADAGLEASGVPNAWEAYCSGEGIAQFVQEKLTDEDRNTALKRVSEPTAEDLFTAVREGDSIARKYLAEINEYNIEAVASLANIFDPGVIVFGGSVVLENTNLVLEPIREGIDSQLFASHPDHRVSTLGSKAGLIGALSLCTSQSA